MFVGNKERAKRDGEKRCFVFPGSLLSGDDAKKIEQAWDKTLAAAASAFWGRRAGMPAVTRWCSTGWRGPRGGKASDVPRAASVGLRHAETSRVRELLQWADRRTTRRREPGTGRHGGGQQTDHHRLTSSLCSGETGDRCGRLGSGQW